MTEPTRIHVHFTGDSPREWFAEEPGQRRPYRYELIDVDTGEVIDELWASGDYHDGPIFIAIEKAARRYPNAEIYDIAARNDDAEVGGPITPGHRIDCDCALCERRVPFAVPGEDYRDSRDRR